MSLQLNNRLLPWLNSVNRINRFLVKAIYLLLTLILIVASAVFPAWCYQLLSLSLILGAKWIIVGQNQVIQIFTNQ